MRIRIILVRNATENLTTSSLYRWNFIYDTSLYIEDIIRDTRYRLLSPIK